MAKPEEAKKLLNFLDRLDDEAKSRGPSRSKWPEYLKVYRGQNPVPAGNPFFQANIVSTEIDRKAAVLGENKPEIFITPRRDGIAATADILQRLIRADWDEQNVSDKLESGIQHIGIFGAMLLGIEWDPLGDYGMGALSVYNIDPRLCRMDPAVTYAEETDAAQFFVIDSLEPLFDIRRRFPGIGTEVKADPRSTLLTSEQAKGGLIAGAIQAARNVVGGITSADGTARGYVRTYWFNDPAMNDQGELIFPYGRRVVRGGDDVILKDGPNPYFDGTWPIVMANGRLDPDNPWGRSDVEGLRRLQESINRVGHMFVDNTIRTGNARVIMDSDALSADEKNKLTNIGAIMINKKFGREVRYEAPNPMPPHFLDFIRFAMQLVDVLSGMSDGDQRREVRSGAMLEGLQTQSQVLIRAMARRMEGLLERLGQKWISRIFQFYDDDRILTWLQGQEFVSYVFERKKLVEELALQATKVVNDRQDKERMDLASRGIMWVEPTGEQRQQQLTDEIGKTLRAAWRDFRFKVTPGSSLAATKMQRMTIWGELARNGIASPKHVLKEMGVENVDEEMQEAIEYLQMLQQAGLQPPGQKAKKTNNQGGIPGAA